jgi:hypothetical protein
MFSSLPTPSRLHMLIATSYIVYIALILGYFVLIWFFFPETKYGPLRVLLLSTKNDYRRMSIEEVSVLFDTGRKGDPTAAALQFKHDKSEKLEHTKDGNVERIESV